MNICGNGWRKDPKKENSEKENKEKNNTSKWYKYSPSFTGVAHKRWNI